MTAANLNVRALGAFFAVAYFIQSLADPGTGIVAQPLRSLLRQWDEGPAEIALFMALVGLPWTAKPLFGLLSDFVPLFGSRRRTYLIVSCISAGLGYALIAGMPLVKGELWLLLALLMLPAIGVAFGDVLIDAIMIDEGQPRGLTGVLQSVQWTAAYAGLLLTGLLGGFFSEIARPDLAFGVCAMLWGVSLVLALFVVKDRPSPMESKALTMSVFVRVAKQPGLMIVGAILFVWNFNPLWTTVLYLHFTEVLLFDEMTFGRTISVFSLGCMLASMMYPLYCRQVSLTWLLHLSIIAGILANGLYLLVTSVTIAYGVSLLAGYAYMTGTMIQMDIAARRVPLLAAATLFACLMALSNLSTSIAEAFGGNLYARLLTTGDSMQSFYAIVAISMVMPALCWLLVPFLKRHLKET